MSGMEPMLIGAALGGGASAAMGKNPIQGALLGGLGGGVFGAASAAGGAAAGTGMGAAGSAVPGVMGAAPAILPSASTTAFGSSLPSVMAPSASGFALNPALPSMIPNIANPALSTAAMSTPFNIAASTAPSFMQTIQNIPSALRQGIMQNPSMASSGMNAAQGLLAPEPMPQAPMPQVQRGQPMAPVNFAQLLAPPQIQQQPISLLG